MRSFFWAHRISRVVVAFSLLIFTGNSSATERQPSPIVLAFSVEDLPGSSPAPFSVGPTAPPLVTGSPTGSPVTGAAPASSMTPAPLAMPPAGEEGQGGGESPSPMGANPTSTPTPVPPALDVSTIKTGEDLATASLVAEIKHAETPALAASLRLTEQARQELNRDDVDSALRELGRAVSIDGGDPWAYYYLGRAYLARKNYAQAATFFRRSALGFTGRPDWLAEALTLDGACQEQLGHTQDAAKAYQRAIAAAPNNFRAKLGYDRVSYAIAPASALNEGAPAVDIDLPPLSTAPLPPPAEAPPPPD